MLCFDFYCNSAFTEFAFCFDAVTSVTIQYSYNIRLLHRSQTATTSNMKQMNTKYNYLIVETKE